MTIATAIGKFVLWSVPLGLVMAVAAGILKGAGHPWLASQVADFATFTTGTIWGWFWSKSEHA